MARECISSINALNLLILLKTKLQKQTKVLFQSETGLLLLKNMVRLSQRTSQSFQSNSNLNQWRLQLEEWWFLLRNTTLQKRSHFNIQRNLNILKNKNHHMLKSQRTQKDVLFKSIELGQECKLHQILINMYNKLQPSNSIIKIQSRSIIPNQWEVESHLRDLLQNSLKLFTIKLWIILLPGEEEFITSLFIMNTKSLSTWRSQLVNTMSHQLKLQLCCQKDTEFQLLHLHSLSRLLNQNSLLQFNWKVQKQHSQDGAQKKRNISSQKTIFHIMYQVPTSKSSVTLMSQNQSLYQRSLKCKNCQCQLLSFLRNL